MYLETSAPIPGNGLAVGFFSQGLRQHVLVEREIGHEPFEPAIFFFYLPEAPQLAYARCTYFFFLA